MVDKTEGARREGELRHFMESAHIPHMRIKKALKVLNPQVLLSHISYYCAPFCLPKRKGKDRNGVWSEPGAERKSTGLAPRQRLCKRLEPGARSHWQQQETQSKGEGGFRKLAKPLLAHPCLP